MRIEINLKIFLVVILFFLINNLGNYLIFMFFIFLHEIAHLIIGILIGGKPKSLYLNPLGISLEFYSYGKNIFFYKIFFYLSGPIFNLLVAVVFYYLKFEKYKTNIIYTNLALCFFNLLPILPLDGGKVLAEILKRITSFNKGTEIALLISKINLFLISFLYRSIYY